MAEVELERDGISYLFTSNHGTLLKSSGFFPSLNSLPQPHCRLETRERASLGSGSRFTILVPPRKPRARVCKTRSLLPQPGSTMAGSQ